ncbi:MAG: alcohol dehydrogenase catalytic domain-containing protein [Candidatus Methanomethylicaceae archaeon]
MKAIVIKEPFKVELENIGKPTIGPEDLLVEVKAVGICGSEIAAYEGTHPWRVPPVISGHEFSGIIVEVGDEVKDFNIGDKITAYPYISCNTCEYCVQGMDNLCKKIKIMGTPEWPGALAEYVRVPSMIAYKLPKEITFDKGALIEPLAVGVHTTARAKINTAKVIVILGVGAIGLCTLLAIKSINSRIKIIAVDPIESKIRIAKELGADLVVNPNTQDIAKVLYEIAPYGADIIIDCAGTQKTIEECINLIRKNGRIVITALFKGKVQLDLRYVMSKEINISGSLLYTRREFENAIILSKKVISKLDKIITHRMSFDYAKEAFELMRKGEAIRVILSP